MKNTSINEAKRQIARNAGFMSVAASPQYAPRNPFDDEKQPELYEAWEAGAAEAGINDRYYNGVLSLGQAVQREKREAKQSGEYRPEDFAE